MFPIDLASITYISSMPNNDLVQGISTFAAKHKVGQPRGIQVLASHFSERGSEEIQ